MVVILNLFNYVYRGSTESDDWPNKGYQSVQHRGAEINRMQYALLGWPDDSHSLRLDYRQFAYAGKLDVQH